MYEYMTRHLVALKKLTYDGAELHPGDAFVATPDDAGYFVRCGRAADAPAVGEVVVTSRQVVEVPQVEEPQVVAPVVRRRGRPPRVSEDN